MLSSLLKSKKLYSQSVRPSSLQTTSKRVKLNRQAYSTYKLNAFEVQKRLIDVLKKIEHVDISKVTPTAHLYKDLEFDSLSNMELLVLLEDEFVIDIKDEEALKLVSCDAIVDYLSKHPLAK